MVVQFKPLSVQTEGCCETGGASIREGYILVSANRRCLKEARGDTADDDLACTILNLLGLQEYIATNQMRRWGGLSESRCNKPPIPTLALSVLPADAWAETAGSVRKMGFRILG